MGSDGLGRIGDLLRQCKRFGQASRIVLSRIYVTGSSRLGLLTGSHCGYNADTQKVKTLTTRSTQESTGEYGVQEVLLSTVSRHPVEPAAPMLK